MDAAALRMTQVAQAWALFRDESQTPEARALARDYLTVLQIVDEHEKIHSEDVAVIAQLRVLLEIKQNE